MLVLAQHVKTDGIGRVYREHSLLRHYMYKLMYNTRRFRAKLGPL